MKDDSIVWFKNKDDFRGFSIRKNHKPNGYDVFGLLKGSGKREIWLLCGYYTIDGKDSHKVNEFVKSFVFSVLISLPLVLNLIVWR